MQARGWYQAGFVAPCLAALVVVPAYADWASYYAHPFMAAFARQAARRVVMYELKKLDTPKRSAGKQAAGRDAQGSSRQACQNGHHGYRSAGHANTGSSAPVNDSKVSDNPAGWRYPTEQKFVPPPPPTPPLLFPTSPLISNASSKPAAGSPLVPPPPPAPSVWDDAQSPQEAPQAAPSFSKR